MKKKGLTPDKVTFNSVINGFCLERNIRAAQNVLCDILEKGLVPDMMKQFSEQIKELNKNLSIFSESSIGMGMALQLESFVDMGLALQLEAMGFQTLASPNRVLEKWLDDKNQTRIERGKRGKKARTKFASLNEDSRFWARVEEALKTLQQQVMTESPDNVMQPLKQYKSVHLL
ncbi:hypothetical protein SUGI_1030100 [Cryptomeria japonica]|nr:hypothetical protein SUGI_1030100 [Cryptomeria japonica]